MLVLLLKDKMPKHQQQSATNFVEGHLRNSTHVATFASVRAYFPAASAVQRSQQMSDQQPLRSPAADKRPVEYYIDEKWDKCIDLTLRRVTYSSLAAGAVALVVLRGGGVRAATTALGAGFGAGSAYSDCQREFRGEVPSVVHHVKRPTAEAQQK